ncbi:Veg family protein [Anaerocaecibacter muris]|uniref:Veg family protein n=1 Tax=Anaerocaecibacter muris TaxID=2941513 RepID=UPI00203E115D|nr:Veg family protein [Anaerocaecibacter muris]
MRQRATSVEEVKRKIAELKGKDLSVAVNRGRKKVTRMSGVIVDLFPSVFTFRAAAGDLVSFSYSDVICGDIVFRETAR